MIIFSLYIIVTATLLVQSFHSAGRNNFQINANPLQEYQRIAFPQSKDSVRPFVSNKNDVFNKALFIKNTNKNQLINEITQALSRILQKVAAPKNQRKRNTLSVKTSRHSIRNLPKQKIQPATKTCSGEKHEEKGTKRHWAKWSQWSPCSVTCGKGREIRWRHCLGNCEGVETEMEEKTCQLPACSGKLFGLIKL